MIRQIHHRPYKAWRWLGAALLPVPLTYSCIEIDPNYQGFSVISSTSDGPSLSTVSDTTDLSANEGHSGIETGIDTMTLESSNTNESSLSTEDPSSSSQSESSASESPTSSSSDLTSSTSDSVSSSASTSSNESTTSSLDSTESTSTDEESTETTTTTQACIESVCFAINEDRPVNNAIYATGGNLAFRIGSDGQAHTIVAIEIYTGEVNGESKIAVRSNSGGLPGSLLGNAGFHISSQNGWQQATLDSPVDVSANGDFWIDWTSISNAQAPIATNGTSVPQAYRTDAASPWTASPSRQTMIRIVCCEL